MAQSPTEAEAPATRDYSLGWAAIHRLVREGSSFSGREKNCSFWNVGDGTYADVSALSGLGQVDDARAAALVDWDRDGALDLWVANRTAPSVRFLRNATPRTNAWVAFDLEGTTSNRDGVGARVEVTLEPEGTDRTRMRLRHDQLSGAGVYDGHDAGWARILGALASDLTDC